MKAFLLSCLLLPWISLHAQTDAPKSTTAPQLPFTTAIRKTVTYITVFCMDGGREFSEQGTGFFVGYPDKRLGEQGSFGYLVTNRHVALCSDDGGHDYPVEKINVRLNLKAPNQGEASEIVYLNEHGNVRWLLPADDSVDLAVLPLVPPQDRYDFLIIPSSLFATREVIEKEKIMEGDRVLFTGLFYRLPGDHKMQPIIREGTLAMLPDEKIKTTRGKLGNIYLADVHVIKGSSGSPVMVNLGGMRQGSLTVGDREFLLGVVSGYFLEDENLNLEVTTTIRGSGQANSGISLIVPAEELKKLLEQPEAQQLRDAEVKAKTGN
jgi:Trypsin-like peptidase domain